jgi:hypothetical protein
MLRPYLLSCFVQLYKLLQISGYCVFEGEMLLRERAMAFEPTPRNAELAKSSPFPCPSVVLLSCVFQKLLL